MKHAFAFFRHCSHSFFLSSFFLLCFWKICSEPSNFTSTVDLQKKKKNFFFLLLDFSRFFVYRYAARDFCQFSLRLVRSQKRGAQFSKCFSKEGKKRVLKFECLISVVCPEERNAQGCHNVSSFNHSIFWRKVLPIFGPFFSFSLLIPGKTFFFSLP